MTLCPLLIFTLIWKLSCSAQQHHPSSTVYTYAQVSPLFTCPRSTLSPSSCQKQLRENTRQDRLLIQPQLSAMHFTYGTNPPSQTTDATTPYMLTQPTLQKYSLALFSFTSEHWSIKQGLSLILYTWKFTTVRGGCFVRVFFLQRMTP